MLQFLYSMLALKIFLFMCCPTHLHNEVLEEFRVNRTACSADTNFLRCLKLEPESGLTWGLLHTFDLGASYSSPSKFWDGLVSPRKPFCLLTVEGVSTIKILSVLFKFNRVLLWVSCVKRGKNASRCAVTLFLTCGGCHLKTGGISRESQPVNCWFQECFTFHGVTVLS